MAETRGLSEPGALLLAGTTDGLSGVVAPDRANAA